MEVFDRTVVTDRAITDAATAYAEALPFPHVVLDGWFTEDALRALEGVFARPTDTWQQYEDGKQATSDVRGHPVVYSLQEGFGRAVVERITGRALLPDPTLRGGGLHEVKPGGRLGIHVDFNRHPTRPLARAVNTLLYLNRGWHPTWHGALTLTDRAGVSRHITPHWNRWVLFQYSETAWHGHPEPLTCPPDRTRRALAVYYYTPLVGDLAFHTTRYAT